MTDDAQTDAYYADDESLGEELDLSFLDDEQIRDERPEEKQK